MRSSETSSHSNGSLSLRKVSDLGKYRLVAELARGGMGVVYLALVRGPAGFNKLLVVKELKAHLLEEPHVVEMFRDEARLSARLSHPNVVQTFEVGSEGDRHYIAMEYLEGETLHQIDKRLRRRETAVPLRFHLKILIDALAGLHYAHELADYDGTPLHVVHRDMSPQNLFVTYDGQIKLVDFGIAKTEGAESVTRTGILKGKVTYMSPEQARGEPVDRRTDIFAVGIMLWEAAMQRRFWGDAQEPQILHRLMTGAYSPAPPARLPPGVPSRLMQIIARTLDPVAERRHPSADALGAELEELATEMEGGLPSARDIGRLVTDLFSERRAELRRLIDTQIRQVNLLTTGEHRSVALLQLNDSLAATGEQSEASGARDPLRDTLAEPVSARSQRSAVLAQQEVSRASLAQSITPAAAADRGRLLVAAGLVAVGLGGAIFAFFALGRPPAAASALGAAPATSASSPSSAAPPPPAPVWLTVRATPAGAQVSVDDMTLQGNPARMGHSADEAAHLLRVEAPGFAVYTDKVRFDRDQTLEVNLVPAPPPSPAGRARGALPAPVGKAARGADPPPAEDPPRPAGRPKHDIDKDDPYK